MIKPDFERDGIQLYCADCMDVLPHLSGVDAVVTDPPYGIGADVLAKRAADQRIKADGKSKAGRGWKDYGESNWDSERPSAQVLESLMLIGKAQIIWGGNYFTDVLPPTMQWLVWDKGQRDFSLADCEFAWSSQWKASRIFNYSRAEALQDGKVHPTQKPIALMCWCIEQLPGVKTICDPFMGSGTTICAAVKLGKRAIGIERERKYFDIAVKRIERALSEERSSLFPVSKEIQRELI